MPAISGSAFNSGSLHASRFFGLQGSISVLWIADKLGVVGLLFPSWKILKKKKILDQTKLTGASSLWKLRAIVASFSEQLLIHPGKYFLPET